MHEYVRILTLYAAWDRRQFLPHAGHFFAAHCVAGFGLGMAEAAPDAALPYGGYWDGVRVRDGCENAEICWNSGEYTLRTSQRGSVLTITPLHVEDCGCDTDSGRHDSGGWYGKGRGGAVC